MVRIVHTQTEVHWEHGRDKYRREGKGRRWCLRDILKCHTNHLAARMIWRTVIGITSILVGLQFGVVWFVVAKSTGSQYFIILFIPFFKSSWCKISPPKQQQRPLPSLLYRYLSFFYCMIEKFSERRTSRVKMLENQLLKILIKYDIQKKNLVSISNIFFMTLGSIISIKISTTFKREP